MIYFVKPNEITTISEKAGTIQNVDSVGWVELSNTADFSSSVILHCHRHVTFSNTQLYARLYDNSGLPVEIRALPVILGGGTSSNDSASETDTSIVATTAEFNTMLDDVFNGNANIEGIDNNFRQEIDNILDGKEDGSSSTPTEGGTVEIDGKTYNVVSNSGFLSALDDIGL